MILRNVLIFSLVLLKFHNYSGCDDAPKKAPAESKAVQVKSDESLTGYDLSEPRKIDLVKELDEISGIAYYSKDSSVFAIVDEAGSLFKIYLNRNNKVKYWRFDSKHDFEDVVLKDNDFFVLISNGNIEKLTFVKDSLKKQIVKFPTTGNKINEFETLYYDPHYGKLVMMCKDCGQDKEDKKKFVSAYGVSPDSVTYSPNLFKVTVDPIAEKLNLEKLHLKPSAAAINPITNDLYILASSNKLLVVLDGTGELKYACPLDATLFKQPEGLAFTPSGDMIISNEAGKSGAANLLIFKYQKDK